MDERARKLALDYFCKEAAGNAVAVHRLLHSHGLVVSLRTVQRIVAKHRQARRAVQLAAAAV